MDFIFFLLDVLVWFILIPVLVLNVQVVSAVVFYLRKTRLDTADVNADVVVLIPAHNESINLIPTLQSIAKQKVSMLRVLVVADNCSDDTAKVALSHGVEVIERNNQHLRGKGYALDFGIQHLKNNQAPDYVVVVDADCLLEEDALKRLINEADRTKRPVQAKYLMHVAGAPSIKLKIAEFAWLLKNYVRPLGFWGWGLPCQLTGSGMVFPWCLLSEINFATGHIVEDMKLGLEFSEINAAPVFCPSATVYSFFPVSEEGIQSQRTRWEHGHLGIIVKDVPSILLKSFLHLNLNSFAMGIDLVIPPLSLMAMILGGFTSLCLTLTLLSGIFAAVLLKAITALIGFMFAIFLFWLFFGRKVVGFVELCSVPYYILMKLPIYLGFVYRRQSEWVRSKRDK